jgi:dolichol-phosphate mannosyltransferase
MDAESTDVRILVVLPAFNEAEALPDLLARWEDVLVGLGHAAEIIVVDDGSTDGTADAARGIVVPVEVIRLGANRGVGPALRAGFERICAIGEDGDLCFTMDADGTQDPRLVERMLPALERGADVVIASRFRPGGGMMGCPVGRRLMSSGLSALMRVLCGIEGVTDYSTFYRGYRVAVLRRVMQVWDGRGAFEANAELLVRLDRSAVVEEVPLVLEYGRRRGTSKMRTFRTVAGYFRMLARNVRHVAP